MASDITSAKEQSCKICHFIITNSTVCIVCRILRKLEKFFLENIETLRVTYRNVYIYLFDYWKRDKRLTKKVCLKQERAKLPKIFVLRNE